MPTDPVAPTPVPMPTAGSMFRQFVQVLVLIVSLLLLVRTVFVEPFGVPTGSMAPAFFGNHREAPCPHCEYPVKVGSATESRGDNPQERTICPNCGHGPFDLTALSREILGDRLLVDKSVFTIRPPRRWEVAVFYTPDKTSSRGIRPQPFSMRAVGSPGEPYVKRVVGLPGETIFLPGDGDVYANGQLCRKTLSQVWETAVPVVNLAYVPANTGWAPRWVSEAVAADPKFPKANLGTASVEGSELTLDASASPDTAIALTYRHRNFKTNKDEPLTDRLGYNGGGERGRAVQDFAIRCEIEVTGGTGLFGVRLKDGGDSVALEFPVGHVAESTPYTAAIVHDGGQRVTGTSVKLVPGKRYRLEFAFVDRRASVAMDGVAVVPVVDLPPAEVDRSKVERPLQFGIRGASVVIRDLILYRDLHYFAEDGRGHAGSRTVPCTLGSDEFFLLGDNASDSWDSREWKDRPCDGKPNPGVPRGAFIGKPFVIHQPLRSGWVTMNGTSRQFTTVDWERVRLLE